LSTTEGWYTPISNNFSSNPVYIDTDTTVVGATNWRGASGGKAYTGGIGIRPVKIIVTPVATAFTAGLIKVNQVTSAATTGAVLFQVVVGASVAQTPLEFDFEGAPPGWSDFIVTGVTATAAVMEIYYRV
jgi:hypothetical protein